MLTDITAVRTYFAKLGLEHEIADIYLALYSHGPQTMSALSRSSGVERTRLYRLIDALLESNLIEVESHSRRGIIKAAPIANLRILITQKEQELRSLTDELELIEQVLARNSLSDPTTRVQLYRGPEGIRQMLTNELDTKSSVLRYVRYDLETLAGKPFMEHWRKREAALDIQTLHNAIPSHCHCYDDTTAYYHHKNGEVFGIEIHNPDIAATQRQLFGLMQKAQATHVSSNKS